MTETKEDIKATFIGSVERTVTLNPPEPGTYYYDVRIKRFYPLFNGEKVITEKVTDLVRFNISRDVFYSPTGSASIRSPYNNPFTGGTQTTLGRFGGGYSTNY